MLETTAQIIVEDQSPMGGFEGAPIQVVPISAPFEIQEQPALEAQDSMQLEPDLTVEINLDGKLVGADDFDPEKARMIEESISVSEDELKEKESQEKDADDSSSKSKRAHIVTGKQIGRAHV